MTKNFLLTAAAVGALAFAGAASAHDLTYRPVTASTTDIDAGNVYSGPVAGPDGTTTDLVKYGRELTGLYLIAEEALNATLASGTLALQNPLVGGSLPSGNNLYTLTLTNATFGTAITGANLVGTNCTSVISSGGGANQSSVTFLVSSSGGGNCAGFTEVNVPVKPTAAGSVSVTSNYTTEAGLAIDGGPSTLAAIFAIDAFQPAVNATFTANGAAIDTFAALALNSAGVPYTTLGGDNQLGKIAIYVDSRAETTLVPTGANANVADVTAASATVVGDFSAFDGIAATSDNPALTFPGVGGAVVRAAIAGNVATFTGLQGTATAGIVQPITSKPNGSTATVTPDGGMINASDYNVGIAFTLTNAYAAQANGAGAFERIDREGTNFIAPWTGGSQAGSQSVIRLSNTGTATGNVTAVLTNAVASGNVAIADTSCNLGPVPAAGDLVVGQAQLTACFPAFLRGDILFTVEGLAANLTAKMRNTSATGTFETTLGRYSGSTITGAAQ